MRGTIKRTADSEAVECFYYPEIFNDVNDIEFAKRLNVSSEGSLTSEVRWEVETKFTIDKLLQSVNIDNSSIVLDYGCGVGRISKTLIERVRCSVVGLDMSPKMREFALGHVRSSNFQVCSSEELRKSNTRYDCAIAAWVLQHCAYPMMDIELIYESLKPKSYFMIIENVSRKLPIKTPSDSTLCWMDDGVDIRKLMLEYFHLIRVGSFTEPELAQLSDGTYWAIYQRK